MSFQRGNSVCSTRVLHSMRALIAFFAIFLHLFRFFAAEKEFTNFIDLIFYSVQANRFFVKRIAVLSFMLFITFEASILKLSYAFNLILLQLEICCENS